MKTIQNNIPDIAGLMCYTPEHDRIHGLHLQIVKNVNVGMDKTPYDSKGNGKYDTQVGYKGYSFWKDYPYSVSIAQKFALKEWSKPDMSDGGYQHPMSHPIFHDIADSMKIKYEACWDNPRNGNGLRFAFHTEKEAEKFISLVKKKFPNMESD